MQGNNNKGGKIKFLARAESNFKPIKCSVCPKDADASRRPQPYLMDQMLWGPILMQKFRSLKMFFENFFNNFFVTLRKRTFPVRIPFFKEDVDSHGKKKDYKKVL